MQQLSRTCLVAEHYSKIIEYVCLYPQCQLSRFICSKCLLGNSHKHNQQDNQHIVDNKDFYEKMMNSLNISNKNKQIQIKYDLEQSSSTLKEIILEIQNSLKNIQNISQQVEQGIFQNSNIYHLEKELFNVQKNGFNQIDDYTLNNLIKIDEQLQNIDIYKQLEEQSNLIMQNAQKFKQWRLTRIAKADKSLKEKILDAQYQIQQIDKVEKIIFTGAISNDLKYIVSGGNDNLLKIWDFQTNSLIKSIKLVKIVHSCKFTDDSKFLYAGSFKEIYQFDVNNKFKKLYKQDIHSDYIYNIYCISNAIILTSGQDESIIITDINLKQQLLKINSHNINIWGLDFSKKLNIIVSSASDDKSIKLWNANDGSLIIVKINLYGYSTQVLFINDDQLISSDMFNNIILWKINFEIKQLEQLFLIADGGFNLSLVLQQQYFISIGPNFMKVYTVEGHFVRQFEHQVDKFCFQSIIQHESMKAILIQGEHQLQICKLDID